MNVSLVFVPVQVTPESVCREIEECPQLMLKVPSGMPAGFVEKLTALLEGYNSYKTILYM